jgi:catechol 2,3-dioxygenase-like lactoylglutathione lyase family enzyme
MDLAAIEAERARLHAEYIKDDRPPSSARGIHHTALLSSDVERTIRFYSEILEFPLTEIIENRDYEGSNHFFFDVGNGNLLAFFDFPGLDLGPYAEVLGGLHHLAISVTPEKWAHLRGRLDAAGVPYQEESGTSLYFRDPDGARLELLADPLGEMYGSHVLLVIHDREGFSVCRDSKVFVIMDTLPRPGRDALHGSASLPAAGFCPFCGFPPWRSAAWLPGRWRHRVSSS